MTLPPRFPVTADQIGSVVATFYGRIRDHAELGPVFATHVTDWPAHEAKIASFWRNAILMERSYDGNPMRVHMAAGNVKPEHFADWLAMFDEVLAAELEPLPARAWSELAHRIGQGLQFGLDTYVTDAGGAEVPRM